jgi:geranylgeranylglycerol-phosphate geranylgeranyltransferase
MAGTAVIVGATIASETFSTAEVYLAFLVAFLVCGAGNVINDYFDFEIDKINNPSRPLPSGKISLRVAHLYALGLFMFGIALCIFINKYALLLAAFNSFLLYLYAWKIKKSGSIEKNFTVSYLVASPFLFGGVAVENASVTLLLALLAGLANTGREIIKDIEDLEGDKKIIKTLPVEIGVEKSAVLASTFILAAVLISPLPYVFGILSINYLVAVALADAVFVYAALNLKGKKAREAQKLVKLGMFFGLVAFLAGSL